jgi:hypothetical protein
MQLPDNPISGPLDPALERFAELLDRRLSRRVFTAEDAVRYTFFVALLETLGIPPDEIVLERPHPRIPRAEMDTFIPSLAGRATAIEFKYDRPIPSNRNLPLPQKAGGVIRDLFRLASFEIDDAIDGLFVHLACVELADYWQNARNGLADLFGLRKGARLVIDDAYLVSRSPTLQSAAGPVVPCEIEGVLARRPSTQYGVPQLRTGTPGTGLGHR